MPGVALIIKLQAVVLLVHSAGLLPTSRLHRRLAFGHLSIIDVSSRMLAGIVMTFFALRGLGAVAFVIGNFTNAMATTLLLWGCAPGVKSLTFRRHHVRELFGYGSGILLIRITNSLASRLDVFIIGRQIGKEAVGLYQRAFHLVLLPLTQVMGVAHKVLFPALSAVQEEQRRFQSGHFAVMRLATLLAFPMLTGLGSTADVIVPLVYGPMWEKVIPILQILIVSGIFSIITNINSLVVQSRGQAMAEATRQGMLLILVAVLGLLGSFRGVFGVAMGVVLAKCIFCISMTRLALSISNIRFIEWLSAMRTGVIGCVVMGLSILAAKYFLSERISSGLLFVVIACIGMLAYVGAIRVCLSSEDSKLIDLVSGILPSRLGNVLRFMFGTNPRSQGQKLDNSTPALPRT